jgi:hypothetical protein
MEDKLNKLKELFPTIDFHGNVFYTINKDDYKWIIRQIGKVEKQQKQITELVCAIYEHANEGTELMEIAERIDGE